MFCLGGAVRPLANGGVSTVFLFQRGRRIPMEMVCERSKNRIPSGFLGDFRLDAFLRSPPGFQTVSFRNGFVFSNSAAKAFYKRPEHTNSTANAMPLSGASLRPQAFFCRRIAKADHPPATGVWVCRCGSLPKLPGRIPCLNPPHRPVRGGLSAVPIESLSFSPSTRAFGLGRGTRAERAWEIVSKVAG